jgi:glycosyltransferase involved in cell wall biosynthesis
MKIFAWCDSPLAPTGFGKSVNHVLNALHAAGWEIVQLSVNQDPALIQAIPWKIYMPIDRGGDPYGLAVLPEILRVERPDLMWSTFDPEVPWRYAVPGVTNPAGQPVSAIDFILTLREVNPGLRTMGWLTVDGGPLSDMELAMLGLGPQLDYAATMSPHVRSLVGWTVELKGQRPDHEAIAKRLNVIPGGVDTEKYFIPTAAQKAEARKTLGLPRDGFIILQLERNQQRKQNYLGLEVLEKIFERSPKLRGKVILSQHMIPDEDNGGCRPGFDLPSLAWRYGLKAGEDVRWPREFLPAEKMPLVYQAADVFLSTSAGEGFQYPAWEALSAGLPLVVPKDTSRVAWFRDAPNVFLYDTTDRRVVMKGSYGRRMADPDPGAAAAKILRLIQKGAKAKAAKAGHAFVEHTAGIKQVQAAWLKVVEEQAKLLEDIRRRRKIVVAEDIGPDTLTVVMEQTPSLSAVIQATTAISALRQERAEDGKRTHFRILPEHLPIVGMLSCADAYETRSHGGEELILDASFADHAPRSLVERYAQRLGVSPDNLAPTIAEIAPAVQEDVRSRFISAFDIDPTLCVGVGLESADPHRALPKAYAQMLAAGIKGMGLTPVLLGRTALNIQSVGTIDLTGKTDLTYLIGLIEQLSAIVTTDSAMLHFAGMVGTPMVACFTINEPASRLRYYASTVESLTATGPIDGERFPAGPGTKAAPGAWAATITPEAILAALRRLVGAEDTGPKLISPGEVHKEIE